MKAANQQLAEWDKELNQLHERNGDLGLEVQNLKEQLAIATCDREENQKSSPASGVASDLSDKAAKVLSFIRPYLVKKVPANLLAKLEEILGED
ncbi:MULTISPECIES: flagellar alpha dynein [unclassified Microcoleus]|uniref:flagellar alpha dynein n=1 Tax=unclassified Microcoleus TaxID=2642155 RepID=UPI002FD5BF29